MPAGDTLFKRLRAATDCEMDALAAVLGLDRSGDREFDVMAISKALRRAAGESLANIFRGDHDLEYRVVLEDVARRLAFELAWTPKVRDGTKEVWLEDYIGFVAAVVDSPRREEMSKAELAELRKHADAALYGKSSASSAVMDATELRDVPRLAAQTVKKFVVVTGPAMRKTIPAVLTLVHSRRRQEVEERLLSREANVE